MTTSIVSQWFGEDFHRLHPMLQALHLHGGRLTGSVEVKIPSGLSGFMGRRLALKLGVPQQAGAHALAVNISHCDGVLLWSRCFDSTVHMVSSFQPVGHRGDGYWLEATGAAKMALTVDIVDGGWHWRCLSIRWLSIPLPVWLFPKSVAYKTIVDGKYQFFVGFSLPCLGEVLSYGGTLVMDACPDAHSASD